MGVYFGEWIIPNEDETIQHYNIILGSSYLFVLETKNFSDLDAIWFGNHTRFINHCPEQLSNLLVKNIKTLQGEQIVFFASKNIQSGEELFFDYGD